MKLLQNKIFIVAVCLVSFILAGLILADRVLGTAGNVSVASVFNMGNKKIINLAPPTNLNDAATKSYVDSVRISVLENRTSDPAGAVVGQMWIRIDQ